MRNLLKRWSRYWFYRLHYGERHELEAKANNFDTIMGDTAKAQFVIFAPKGAQLEIRGYKDELPCSTGTTVLHVMGEDVVRLAVEPGQWAKIHGKPLR
jgi:hypothetical protein